MPISDLWRRDAPEPPEPPRQSDTTLAKLPYYLTAAQYRLEIRMRILGEPVDLETTGRAFLGPRPDDNWSVVWDRCAQKIHGALPAAPEGTPEQRVLAELVDRGNQIEVDYDTAHELSRLSKALPDNRIPLRLKALLGDQSFESYLALFEERLPYVTPEDRARGWRDQFVEGFTRRRQERSAEAGGNGVGFGI